MDSLVLNLTPGMRAVLENLLTIAGRLEDDARIVDHLPDDWYGDLDEFRKSFYLPLKDGRSGPAGQGDNYSLDRQDACLVFDVVKGLDDGWVGGTPWVAMSPAERAAVERFLETLRRSCLGFPRPHGGAANTAAKPTNARRQSKTRPEHVPSSHAGADGYGRPARSYGSKGH